VAQLVPKTLKTKPQNSTHWSIRQIAGETGVSKSTVHRIWQAFGLPHRQKYFKLSGDPFFARYLATIIYGMAVQAAGGASRDKLQHVVEMTLRALPL
jgi:transcriptional regulator with XRE-family HTH domain